jgi:lipid-binding SYLF domain-containing protein
MAMMTFRTLASAALVVGGLACASGPDTVEEQENLQERAEGTLREMQAKDSGLEALIDQSYGYVVFPEISKGGVLVGGATGTGVAYEQGVPIGSVTVNQASIGATLGGQSFSELILFENEATFRRITGGKFTFGADASAVALKAGAAASGAFRDGVAVFVMPRGGLMVDLSVRGQELDFQPAID